MNAFEEIFHYVVTSDPRLALGGFIYDVRIQRSADIVLLSVFLGPPLECGRHIRNPPSRAEL